MKTSLSTTDCWLLPDGVPEVLPGEALLVDRLRRQLLDLFGLWGYDLVIPPLIEFTDSLLSGVGEDLDLLTFKMVDQLSGRTMGIRADITPQTARMDAHSLFRSGPSRLCYSGHVLHTRPKGLLESRCPLQAGVELYGEAGVQADVEVLCLLLESLQQVGLKQLHLDLGSVDIYRALARTANLSTQAETQLFDLLQRKELSQIDTWLQTAKSAGRDYSGVSEVAPFEW